MPISREEIYENVVAILVETVGISPDEIAPDKTLREDLGIDSLSMVEILTAAEDQFDIRIPDEDAKDLTDVRAVVAYLERTAAQPDDQVATA